MSHAAAATLPLSDVEAEKKVLGVTNGKLAMWIFLGSDGMSFMGLIATYVALRFNQEYYEGNWPSPGKYLGITLTAINTFILICSSVTMVKAFEGAVEHNVAKLKKYLALTILGGCLFLSGQAYEYTHFFTGVHMEDGSVFRMFLSGIWNQDPSTGAFTWMQGSRNFGSTFFVLTSFHGCHVFSGVVYLLCVLIGVMRGRWSVNRVEILGLYWHFVDLVWIVIFTIVYLVETRVTPA
jgi:heme/copper-type cytochrome/quinol oxidase subunit 3